MGFLDTLRRVLRVGGGRASVRSVAAMQEATQRPDYELHGESGTKVTGGVIWNYDAKFTRVQDWVADAEEMMQTDPVVRGGVRAHIDTQLTARGAFKTEAAWPEESRIFAAELDENFGFDGGRGYIRGGWEGLGRRILRHQFTGFRYLEALYCPEQGRVWVDFADREPSAHAGWYPGPDGQLAYVEQERAGGGRRTRIPANKLVLFTEDQTGNNWNGTGLLRSCHFAWKLKTHAMNCLAIGVERYAVKIPRVKVNEKTLRDEQGYSETDINTMVTNAQTTCKNLTSHEQGWVSTVEGIDIDVIQIDFRADQTAAVIEVCNREILTGLGLQQLLLGVNGTGSRAVGSVHDTGLLRMLTSGLNNVAAVIGGEAAPGQGTVGRLRQWNHPGLDPKFTPRMQFKNLDPGPLLNFAETLRGLIYAGGVTPTNELEDAFLQQIGQPALQEQYKRSPAERQAAGNPMGAAASLFSEGRAA